MKLILLWVIASNAIGRYVMPVQQQRTDCVDSQKLQALTDYLVRGLT